MECFTEAPVIPADIEKLIQYVRDYKGDNFWVDASDFINNHPLIDWDFTECFIPECLSFLAIAAGRQGWLFAQEASGGWTALPVGKVQYHWDSEAVGRIGSDLHDAIQENLEGIVPNLFINTPTIAPGDNDERFVQRYGKGLKQAIEEAIDEVARTDDRW